jgi:four helix bundle protein
MPSETTVAIRTVKDLKIYQAAYRLALEVFEVTKHFPREETSALVDQLRRSARSIAGNIREGYAKRRYEQVFVRHLNDALGSCEETRTWLDFGRDAGYLSAERHAQLEGHYDELSAMLYSLMENWQQFD